MNKKITYKVTTVILSSIIGLSIPCYADDSSQVEKKSLLQSIIDKYIAASKTDEALKYLLDAKMDLSAAEHDLLLSNNITDATENIENTITYLEQAKNSAKPTIKNEIETLRQHLKLLEKKTLSKENNDLNNDVDQLLGVAQSTLTKAQEHTKSASSTKQKIIAINKEIQALRNQIEHNNLKEDYKSAMHSLNAIIDHMSK